VFGLVFELTLEEVEGRTTTLNLMSPTLQIVKFSSFLTSYNIKGLYFPAGSLLSLLSISEPYEKY